MSAEQGTLDIVSNLDDIRGMWSGCDRCGLSKTRNKVVVGDGNEKASIILIGEVPGRDEDATGVPFVGESGDLLKYALKEVLDIEWESLFTTNIVGCRPPENRNPTPEEIKACWPRIAQIIYHIDPILIVTLGGVSTRTLIRGKSRAITEARGDIVPVSFAGKLCSYDITVLPTFHPSYALRIGRQDMDSPLHKMGEDLYMADKIVKALTGR